MEKKNLTKTVVGFGITAAAFALTPNATALAAEVPPSGDANDEVVAVTTIMQEEKVNDKLIDQPAPVVEDIQSIEHQTSPSESELEDLTESSNDVTEGIEESNSEGTEAPLVDPEIPTDSSNEVIEDTLEENVDKTEETDTTDKETVNLDENSTIDESITEETVSKEDFPTESDQTVEEKGYEEKLTDAQDNSTSTSETPKAEEKKDPLSNINSKQDFASYLLNLSQTNTANSLKENTKADVLAIFDKYFKDYADFERYLNTKDEFNPDGSLTDATQERVLTMLNFIRELNGLKPVTLDKNNSTTAQKGLEFLNKNDLMIDHNAAAGKDDVAHNGLNNSNLALSFSGNSVKELLGFFLDNDSSHNWNNAGHRHWLLSPELNSIGVASVVATGKYKGTQYFAIYIGDYSYKAPHPDYIFYPGNGLFPTEILDTDFNLPHSIMLGDKYLNRGNTIPNYRDLDITITLGNGQTLKLPFGEEGQVDCYNVGVEVLGGGKSTIILKFSDEIWKLIKQYGYTVTIKGLTIDGKPADPLVLNAKYFSLKDAYNERANAKDVITGINGLKDPSQVTLEDKDTIINLYQKYQNLTDDQKQYVTAEQTQKLTDAYNKIQELIKAQEENQKAADAVSEKINGIGEVTLDSEQAITDARTAYNDLTDDQKALVSSETLKKLDDAEKRLTELKEEQRLNQEAADHVSGLINALPENITLENKSAVEEAKQAYDNLTEVQKALVSDITVQKLNVAKAEIERLEKIESDRAAAQTVIDKITALPGQITLDDEQAIIDAETALNALTADQKGYVDSELIKKLTDARDTLEILKLQQMEDQAAAQKVTDLVANYDGKELTIEDVAGVEQLLNMYKALTPEQKAYLTSETVDKIGSLETKINEIKEAHAHDVEMAQKAQDLINAIPDTVTLDSEEAILAAQSAYDNLTETQKSLIPGEALSKLNNAQERLAILKAEKADQEAAQLVTDAIAALPSDITTQDRTAIEEARKAYDALTDAQKQYISKESLSKLEKAESDLQVLVDQDTAQKVVDQIANLPSQVTSENRQQFVDAIDAYNALSDAQKKLVPEDRYAQLILAQSKLEKFDQDNNSSINPPTGNIVVDGDKVYAVDGDHNILDERSISGNPNTGSNYQDGLLAAVLALTGLGGAMFIGKKRSDNKEN